MTTAERHVEAGGQVLDTPLARWSDANMLAGELHVALGKAYASAMVYGEPAPAVVGDLVAKARHLLALLEARP